ncbi:uncharacterized protein A1O9_03735 [Exophiala aquamarina CBS 119918]|uniref:RWD domain-containing protein n=1 Tax=Exophiala aquamarina CBS 119918 TaxID=1182545 RepID=A0A072PGL9_9EURO|nr:uncharacterized protein A1O9_03735 [Exophiala aquamarina CBS 119918]KEF58892.1 hypothetical protein A1O9_03735 [Exophiala aquamarina CBS 119918]
MTENMTESPERLEAELSLLEAMYPSSITYAPRSRELWFKASSSSGELKLRLPDSYPGAGFPTLISARDGAKNDLRDHTRRMIADLDLVEGEEGLDRIIVAFDALVYDLISKATSPDASLSQQYLESAESGSGSGSGSRSLRSDGTHAQEPKGADPMAPKTVIIWLHHLLATSKRKLAIAPSLTVASPATSTPAKVTAPAISVSGLSKPGYPGIMIFSGAAALVDAHVRELKDLNWQAFQVRYDSSEDDGRGGAGGLARRWKFKHEEEDTTAASSAERIVEVETMADLVKGIVDEGDREVFLHAVGVK